MLNFKFRIFIFTVLLSIFYFLNFSFVFATKVFFEPSAGEFKVGDDFSVKVILDTESQEINAIDLTVLYPELLSVNNVSKSGSIIQLWVQEPSFTPSGMFLTGGVPGGINTNNGFIARLNLRAKSIGAGGLSFVPSSSVLLNDGQGTSADLKVAIFAFNILPREKEKTGTPIPESSPQIEEIKDSKKPKKFRVLIGSDPRVFDGQYFVSFFTTDVESGIDYYEMKEGKGPFKIAQSPYFIEDQKLRSVIKVRAYDAAGNYRESVYPGFFKRIWLWTINLF